MDRVKVMEYIYDFSIYIYFLEIVEDFNGYFVGNFSVCV